MFHDNPDWQKVDPNLFIPAEARLMYDPRRDAGECEGQHPIISPVGRGLKGDSYRVRIIDVTDPDYPDPLMHKADETYLIGEIFDEITKEWKPDPAWLDANGEYYNINGGQLWYKYNYRPVQPGEVGTFTISFKVTRPNRPTWTWTTQPIPYILTPDEIGNGTIGAGVATVYYNKGDYKDANDVWKTRKWTDELHYPHTPWVRADFNPPDQPNDGRGLEAYVPYPNSHVWTVNLMAGQHGNMNVPSLDDLALALQGLLVLDPATKTIRQITNATDYLANGLSATNSTRPTNFIWDADAAVRGQQNNPQYTGTNYGGITDNKIIIPPTITSGIEFIQLYTGSSTNLSKKITVVDFLKDTGITDKLDNIDNRVDDLEDRVDDLEDKVEHNSKAISRLQNRCNPWIRYWSVGQSEAMPSSGYDPEYYEVSVVQPNKIVMKCRRSAIDNSIPPADASFEFEHRCFISALSPSSDIVWVTALVRVAVENSISGAVDWPDLHAAPCGYLFPGARVQDVVNTPSVVVGKPGLVFMNPVWQEGATITFTFSLDMLKIDNVDYTGTLNNYVFSDVYISEA